MYSRWTFFYFGCRNLTVAEEAHLSNSVFSFLCALVLLTPSFFFLECNPNVQFHLLIWDESSVGKKRQKKKKETIQVSYNCIVVDIVSELFIGRGSSLSDFQRIAEIVSWVNAQSGLQLFQMAAVKKKSFIDFLIGTVANCVQLAKPKYNKCNILLTSPFPLDSLGRPKISPRKKLRNFKLKKLKK